MKVVFYQGQKKFTIDNVTIPNIDDLKSMYNQEEIEMSIKDLQLCSFKITSTRGLVFEDEFIEDEELEKEVEEGINYSQVTVN